MVQNKLYKVKISEESQRGLGRIVSFVALNSIQAARVLKKDIVAEISSLKFLPERTPFLEGEFIPFNKYHKLVVRRNYLVIYQIKDDTVLMDYGIDCHITSGSLGSKILIKAPA